MDANSFLSTKEEYNLLCIRQSHSYYFFMDKFLCIKATVQWEVYSLEEVFERYPVAVLFCNASTYDVGRGSTRVPFPVPEEWNTNCTLRHTHNDIARICCPYYSRNCSLE